MIYFILGIFWIFLLLSCHDANPHLKLVSPTGPMLSRCAAIMTCRLGCHLSLAGYGIADKIENSKESRVK